MKQRFSKRTRLVSALLTLAMVFTFLPFSAFAAGGVTGGYSTINAGIVVLDKTAGETISIVPKNAAHAILRC